MPLKTTERRRLDADNIFVHNLLRGTGVQECVFTNAGVKECTDGEMIWELADPETTVIPDSFLWDESKYQGLTGTLKLGAAVKKIGRAAFYQTKLTGLDLSQAASLKEIGFYAFGFTRITGTLVIPANVKRIENNAFIYTEITGLDLSVAAKLKSIGAKAFRNTNITGTIVTPFTVPAYKAAPSPPKSHSFPSGVSIVSIPGLKKCDVAPNGTAPCWELKDTTMEYIPADFLKDNTDLTGTLKLGAAVKSIGGEAFRGTKLTGLDLSQAASLVSIGDGAFGRTDITGPIVTPFNVPTYTTGGSTASFPSGVWIVKVPKEPADPTTAEPSIVPTIEWPNAFPTGGSIVKGSSP